MKLYKKHILVIGFLLGLTVGLSAQNIISVRPVEIDDVLVNPGIGFTTFQMFNGDNLQPNIDVLANPDITVYEREDKNLENKGYPMTSIAYFRILWQFIEPARGEYRWDFIDNLLRIAHERGQTLMLRIAPYKGRPGTDVPGWYRSMVGTNRQFAHHKWVVDPEDPRYIEYFGKMIRSMGERYDGHPDLESVDVSIVGWAGEGGGTELLSHETMKKLMDAYLEAFKKTPLIILLQGKESNLYAASGANVGWRQDCLGDLDFWAAEQNGWTHMYDYYPQSIINNQMEDAWKKAPVVFEVCGDMLRWKNRQGYGEKEVNYIIEQSLKWHISSFNNKSSQIPEEWWPMVNKWLNKMGYRFVLRKFSYPESCKNGGKLVFTSWWENKGVAPCYKDYLLAIRLKNRERDQILITNANIRNWLPGDNLYDDAVFIPYDLNPGDYLLQIGIIDPMTSIPKIALAIRGKEPDGWYSLGKIKIRKTE
ncbi:MAG: DUF4832 domain-containing protein [Chlorobi bacterium]|nr:DUF4832 domain-containing protein [Chlorobiota bacterium]